MATTIHTTTTPKPTLAGATPPATGRQRLESLDIFRGLTIAGMILVNDPGSDASYWPLNHADELMTAHPSGWYPGKAWVDANGWTPTDLIFPFFLFIVGTSMVLSFAARRARGDSRPSLMKHAARRSALILLIGYAIRILPYVDFSHMRYPGVLQRIAVVYLCASVIPLWTSSYVLFTAGAACLLLALCWWLIEMRGSRLWSRPFLWLGSNAILAYALSTFAGKLSSIIKLANGITLQTWIYEHWFAPLAQEKNASLAFALCYLALWTMVAWPLYRKKIFVKV